MSKKEHEMAGVKVYQADLEKDFQEDPRNANKGTQRGNKMLETSIEQFGAARSIVSDADGFIVAGNKTREALIEAALSRVVVVEIDGNTPVIVKRTDWQLGLKGGAARRYAYADNRVAEIDLEWDADALKADMAEGVDLSSWFTADELTELAYPNLDDDQAGDEADEAETKEICPTCKKARG